ncbi:MAG: hypothetical protein ACERKN_01375 [Velocimicrobium sp.]
MEFIVDTDGKLFEISELIKEVSFSEKLNDGCSKLEFSYVEDELKIQNGSIVRFVYDDFKFFGRVFKHASNSKQEISVTAYDQLRYAKAKDSIVIENDTVTTLCNRMCNNFGFRTGKITDTKYQLKKSVKEDKTWLDIIYEAISDTLTNKGKWYSMRDEYGRVAIRDLEDLTLNLILGDKSLCYEFDYSKSIDDEFYNQIKLFVKGKEIKESQMVVSRDIESIDTYGFLQYYEKADENSNLSQAKAKADMLLRLYNREAESLTLKCLGDKRIRAGNSFYAQIGDIDMKQRLIVKNVTHSFLPVHTMSIEVCI